MKTRRAGRMALLFGAAILSACNALTDTDDLEFVLGPEGEICSDAATDCPPASDCRTVKCEARRCIIENLPAGPLKEQMAGDCEVRVCDGNGGFQPMPDNYDFVADDEECTLDACVAGAVVHTPMMAKTPCMNGQGLCNAGGSCVGCVDDADCDKPNTCSEAGECVCLTPCPAWNKDFGVGEGRRVTTDGSGNVLVTGWFSGTADFDGAPLTSSGEQDIFVAKFSADGAPIWRQGFGDAMSQSGSAVAADSAGNVILAGSFAGSVDFGSGPLASAGGADVFLAKLKDAGNMLWSKRFGDSLDEEVTGVAVDGGGYIVLTGRFKGTIDLGGGPQMEVCSGLGDLFVAKFDPDGMYQWSKGYCVGGDARAAAVATDNQSNILLTGHFNGSVKFGMDVLTSDGLDAFAVKLKPNGDHAWSRVFGGAGAQEGTGVVADKDGHAIVSGAFEGSTDFGGGGVMSEGKLDAFVAKLSAADGSTMWSKRFGDAEDQRATGVGVDGSGNPVVTGVLSGSVNFGGGSLPSSAAPQIFVAKLTGDQGEHLFSRVFGGVGPGYHAEIAADASGGVVLTGHYTGGLDFGLGGLPYSEPDMSTTHTFLVRFLP